MNNQNLEKIKKISQKISNIEKSAEDEFQKLHEQGLAQMTIDPDYPDGFLSVIVGDSGEDIVEGENISVLGELQAFEPFLAGYVSKISKSRKRDRQEVQGWLTRLQKYKILKISHVQEWYMDDDKTLFQNLKNYVELLDYLRLLLIEYINSDFQEHII
jgi:hypothetical protein